MQLSEIKVGEIYAVGWVHDGKAQRYKAAVIDEDRNLIGFIRPTATPGKATIIRFERPENVLRTWKEHAEQKRRAADLTDLWKNLLDEHGLSGNPASGVYSGGPSGLVQITLDPQQAEELLLAAQRGLSLAGQEADALDDLLTGEGAP